MSDTSDLDLAVLAHLIEAGICPRFDHVPLLSEEAADILGDALQMDVNAWGDDAVLLKINGQSFEIPRILTSRGTLDLLGFTESRVEELWNSLKEADPRVSPLTPKDEFGKRMTEYVDEITNSIHLRNEEGHPRSSAELLDALGLTDDAQSHLMELISGHELGRLVQPLRESHPDYVLTLAKSYIQHRWNFLQEIDSLIVVQQEGWREEIVKGFMQLPIESVQAWAAVLRDLSPLKL